MLGGLSNQSYSLEPDNFNTFVSSPELWFGRASLQVMPPRIPFWKFCVRTTARFVTIGNVAAMTLTSRHAMLFF
jgi:hypothetical protein